jgi:crotonobetainyl-CoA:carnitine CoA-transferase CaiB-like acyl-CoA transferase
VSQGPIEGFRVVELAQGIPGALCGMHLGDGGADVIKVEDKAGDIARELPPFYLTGESSLFISHNRNKRGVQLDLRSSEGREALGRLIDSADVLIEDVDLTRELGLDVATLVAGNRRLVHARISGWGPKGPLADQPGGEIVAQMASEATLSLGSLTDAPVRLGTDAASSYAGVYAAQGILAALFRRYQDGEGQTVDVSLFGVMLMMRTTLWAALSNPDDWFGFHNDSYVKPADHGYQCKDGTAMLVVGRLDEAQWDALLADLGLDTLSDQEKTMLKTQGGVNARFGHLSKPIWEKGLKNFTVEDAAAKFNKHGGNAYRINDYPHTFAHSQTQHLGIQTEVQGANGPLKIMRPPWQFSEDPVSVRLAPPTLGQHTAEVLGEVGYDAGSLQRLQAAGVLG